MTRKHFVHIVPCVATLICLWQAGPGWAADAISAVFDPGKATAKNATLTPAGEGAARIEIKGATEGPAGMVMAAAGGTCDLSEYRFVVAEVRGLGSGPVAVRLRLENGNAASFVADGLKVDPQTGWTWIKVGVRRPADAVKVRMFGMAEYPWGRPYEKLKTGAEVEAKDRWWLNAYPWSRAVEPADGPGVDPAAIAKLLVFVDSPKEACSLEVRSIRPVGAAPSAQALADPAKFFPCIDEFGQYIHADWPGKTHSTADLKKQREAEAKDLAANPGPEEWDQYGGWKNGPSLKATGSFYVTKYEGKWWMVDPEGKLFFSNGITCVSATACDTWQNMPGDGGETDETPIQDREQWFRSLGALQAEFASCVVTGTRSMRASGYYGFGPLKAAFDFPRANNMRKYGATWKHDFTRTVHARLRSWGINTAGAYSSLPIVYQKRTPYIACNRTSRGVPKPPAGPWNSPDLGDGIFWDVFRGDMDGADPAALMGDGASDEWRIGYILNVQGRGEQPLDLGDDVAYALGSLRQAYDPAVPNCAKAAFVTDLKGKYLTIEALNATWGTSHASWDALLASRETPDPKKARDDLAAFTLKAFETYFQKADWWHSLVSLKGLRLGTLLEPRNTAAAAAESKYCDALCYRLNRNSPADFKLPAGIDMPVLIAEFGFSALDRGLLAGNLPDQAARAAAYKQYMLDALKHPQIIGCHWSQFRDYPASGRARDEANYNAGFVDVADTPYSEMVAAAREIAKTMYRTRLESK